MTMIALLAALPTTLTLLEASGAASGDGVALGLLRHTISAPSSIVIQLSPPP